VPTVTVADAIDDDVVSDDARGMRTLLALLGTGREVVLCSWSEVLSLLDGQCQGAARRQRSRRGGPVGARRGRSSARPSAGRGAPRTPRRRARPPGRDL